MKPAPTPIKKASGWKVPGAKPGHLENVRVRIANRLAALRKEQRLTLKQLAERAGLTETYLSRLENHKAPLPVENLSAISSALGVPVEMFFAKTGAPRPLVFTRRGQGKPAVFRGRHGFAAQLLAHGKTRKLMEPLLLTISADHATLPLQSHHGQEFNYVLKGRCLLEYGAQKFVLEEGDSAYYDADVPHIARPLDENPCQLLAVIGSDEYAFHGNLLQLLSDD